jgi:hypothetical protein
VERAHPDLSIRRQCELLGVNRAGLYGSPQEFGKTFKYRWFSEMAFSSRLSS